MYVDSVSGAVVRSRQLQLEVWRDVRAWAASNVKVGCFEARDPTPPPPPPSMADMTII